MADHTLLNLRADVEDSASAHGLSPMMESHFARGALGLESSGVSLFRYAPGFRAPFGHRHRRQEEVYVVVSGSARVAVGDEVIEMGPWDALRVAPGTMRCVEGGPEGVELIAVGAPAVGQDGEIVPGWWAGAGS